MLYLPDLFLALGLAISMLLGWRRAPGPVAPVVGLAALAGAAAVLWTQPLGYTRPLAYWAAVEAFVIRFDRRLDALSLGSASLLLAGLAIWLLIGLAAARVTAG